MTELINLTWNWWKYLLKPDWFKWSWKQVDYYTNEWYNNSKYHTQGRPVAWFRFDKEKVKQIGFKENKQK